MYATVTVEPLVDTEVSTRPFCSMLMIVEPAGVVVPLAVRADAPVKVTVPQFASGTSELPDSKSSTIHSAFSWQSAGCPEKVCETVWPVERFSIVAVPPVRLVAVTETWIWLPGLSEMPVKSCAKSGNHSNHAGGRIREREMSKREEAKA